MIKFLARRLLSAVVLLVAITAVAYIALTLAAGDVAANVLGPAATDDAIVQLNSRLGLERPVVLQYLDWLAGAVQGDLGTSWFNGEPVGSALAIRIPVTLSLLIGVLIVSTLVSFALGTLAALRPGRVDSGIQVLSVVGYALPGFLIALFLATVFAVQLRWFPATGYVAFTDSPGGWLAAVILPVVALSFASTAATTQQVRSSVSGVLRQDFVRTLQSRGLPWRRVLVRHVVRNASAAPLSVLALQFVSLLSSSVVAEVMFALPGIGSFAVTETARGDIPLVMGIVVVTLVIVVVVNLLVSLVIGWLNPKVRTS